MDVVINIEPDREDEMCPRNQQKPQKKRSYSIWFWLCLIIVPVVLISGGVTAYYLISRADPIPEPTTISPESPSTTTTLQLPEETTPPPITTTAATPETTTPTTISEVTAIGVTIKPYAPGDWLKDVPMLVGNAVLWQVRLFYGQFSHTIMLSVCNRKAIWGVHRAVYFNTNEEEASFDKIIRANSASVFGNIPPYNETRLLWTGCYYENTDGAWKPKCGKDIEEYNNFCNQPGWKNDLEQLKASTVNKVIYILKDYGRDNASCWQLYDSTLLKSIMDTNEDPILPFTCIASPKSA